MFNKKLKEKIKELEEKNKFLQDKLNDTSWKQEPLERMIKTLKERIEELEGQNAFECECVSERDKIIEAQGILLTYFSSYIVANDVKNKKVQTKTIKIKMKKGKK